MPVTWPSLPAETAEVETAASVGIVAASVGIVAAAEQQQLELAYVLTLLVPVQRGLHLKWHGAAALIAQLVPWQLDPQYQWESE